ncbi:MAG: Hsp20/alpha crystallin family protein, partial [Candidatus Omnitrophota bacterium]
SQDTTDQARAQAVERARQDYRQYLTQLKSLSDQYKEVTGQITQVIKEEGVPTWDDKTGSLKISKDLTGLNSSDTARIQEEDKLMNVSIDLPGLKKDSIKVSIQDVKVLKISGTRKIGQETVPVEQTVQLPAPAEEKGTEARYEDGVLTVKIHKATQKEISVPIR